jgi:glycolate oxidase
VVTAPVLDALAPRLSGGALIRTDPDALAVASADKSGHRAEHPPLAVVEAAGVADVEAVIRVAGEHGVPVVPRGAGTGLAGGAIGGRGELVLSVARMDAVLEIDVDDEVAVVEPGVINGDLNARLAPLGLWYAPDPASRAISTIGGNIATNAGGLLCAKYGVTRESVLGLEVVTGAGETIRTGHRTVKGVTGYDLTALMVGSEGTLGVVVEATLKLRPLPPAEAVTLGATFDDVASAARASAVITSSRLRPAIMELLDAPALDAIAAHTGEALPDAGAWLLVQFDGAAAARDADAALTILTSLGARVDATDDPAEGERLFAIRRAFHPALERLGTVLIEDVAVPRSRLPEMFAAITELEGRYGLRIPTVAHAGDGNLHPNFITEGETPPEVWRAADELFRAALRLGGTLTGEHGVGLLKRRWLEDEIGADQHRLQRAVKAAFDPRGVLNPGKVF